MSKEMNILDYNGYGPDFRFKGLPPLTEYIDGTNCRLVREVGYTTKAGPIITVRVPFVFDWASIPRMFQWLYPPCGIEGNPYGIAALVHDWLYVHRKIEGEPITRFRADQVFYEVMRYVGCRWTLARLMYRAVRVGGWMPWNNRKPEDIIQ